MCNLYSITKGQAAIIAFTRAMRDTTGNLPSLMAPAEDALKLQRPLSDGALKIVATGNRKDEAA
jgi:hypothetical protein